MVRGGLHVLDAMAADMKHALSAEGQEGIKQLLAQIVMERGNFVVAQINSLLRVLYMTDVMAAGKSNVQNVMEVEKLQHQGKIAQTVESQ